MLCLIATYSKTPIPHQQNHSNAHDAGIRVDVDLANGHSLSDTLFGIFFEEINHAGEGGLYAEMVMDRSFDELALTQHLEPAAEHVLVHDIARTAFSQPSYRQRIQSHRPRHPSRWNSSLAAYGCASSVQRPVQQH